MFAGNFAPRGWAFCDGQILPIASHTALFSLLGTTYGGDGRTTFRLPDLRSRVPIHRGNGPGLPSYALGAQGGLESNTLNVNNLPPHAHTNIPVSSEDADQESPVGGVIAKVSEDTYHAEASSGSNYGNGVNHTGGGQPIPNMMPSAVVNYIIALVGIYPSRN